MRISLARGAIAVILLVLTACSSSSSEVTGSVNKLDRMALPPDAVVNVELRDTSLQDAPAITISTDVIELDGNQLPVPYVLEYDEDQIIESNVYTVFVRIEVGETLLYITDSAYPVITRDNPTQDVEVFVVQVSS